MSANDWKTDKCVKNWFELIGNERTIKNYSNDFPKGSVKSASDGYK